MTQSANLHIVDFLGWGSVTTVPSKSKVFWMRLIKVYHLSNGKYRSERECPSLPRTKPTLRIFGYKLKHGFDVFVH
jgi:hypothetical protein